MKYFYFLCSLIILTNCSKTNNKTINIKQKSSNSIWKIDSEKSYALGQRITISLQNISDKQVLIKYPNNLKIEQQVGENWKEIPFIPYPCMSRPALLKYEPVNSQQIKRYTWKQNEKWCEGNIEKTKAVSKGKYRLKVSYTLEEDTPTEKLFVTFEIK